MIFQRFFAPAVNDGLSLLASDWVARGNDAADIVLGNDSNGYLTVTSSALVERSFIRPVSNPAITDGTVSATILIEGWETTTAQYICGPGIRMSGTDGSNNMSGYGLVLIREGAVSGDPFRARMRELTAGVNALIGTVSGAIPGGLLTTWADMSITTLTQGANADISCEARREGQAAADYTNIVAGDVTPRTGTEVGIFINSLPTTHTIRIKYFGVS